MFTNVCSALLFLFLAVCLFLYFLLLVDLDFDMQCFFIITNNGGCHGFSYKPLFQEIWLSPCFFIQTNECKKVSGIKGFMVKPGYCYLHPIMLYFGFKHRPSSGMFSQWLRYVTKARLQYVDSSTFFFFFVWSPRRSIRLRSISVSRVNGGQT